MELHRNNLELVHSRESDIDSKSITIRQNSDNNDTLSEGPEEFNLKVTAVAGSAEPGDYTGQAVIYDNQMGQLMTGNVSNGVVDTDVTSSLDDDFDKDGIPPNVEQALADLANAAGKGGGKPGDLNNDGY